MRNMNPEWLSAGLTDWLTYWLTARLSVYLSVCLTLWQLPWRHLATTTTLPCNCVQLLGSGRARPERTPHFYWPYACCQAMCMNICGNSYEFSGTSVCVSGSGPGPRDTYTGTGRKDESTPKRRYYGNFTTWWCARLFGYLGKSSNLFAIVVDTAIHCNCVEIDMRCYFNRSFPSLPLYSHSHSHSNPPTPVPILIHCITHNSSRAAFAGEIWFMHISIWFISLASSNRTPKIKMQNDRLLLLPLTMPGIVYPPFLPANVAFLIFI